MTHPDVNHTTATSYQLTGRGVPRQGSALAEDWPSYGAVLARVIELGVESLARQVRDAERDRLYAAWANDPERLAAAQFHEEAAAQTGAF